MRIAVDARELLRQPTGVGRYLAELCAEWARLPADAPHRFELYAHLPGDTPGVLGHRFDDLPARFTYRGIGGAGDTWWEQHHFARALGDEPPDVLFAPAYTAPLRTQVPVVLTVHDISFETRPEWFGWREGLRRRWLTRQSVARASRIISVSGFTRDELVRHFRVPAERVRVVWSGVPHGARSTGDHRDREPLVLFVGSIFNRRHIPELIQAFAQVASDHPGAELVLVGSNRTHPPQAPVRLAERAGVADRVLVRDYVEEAELQSLYARASVFAFLSEYEGFGLPPLEAMAAGIPVVVGDTPVARELYGEAAWRVPVDDVGAIGNAPAPLLADPDARQRAVDAAGALLPRFTWARAAAETLQVLEEAVGG